MLDALYVMVVNLSTLVGDPIVRVQVFKVLASEHSASSLKIVSQPVDAHTHVGVMLRAPNVSQIVQTCFTEANSLVVSSLLLREFSLILRISFLRLMIFSSVLNSNS